MTPRKADKLKRMDDETVRPVVEQLRIEPPADSLAEMLRRIVRDKTDRAGFRLSNLPMSPYQCGVSQPIGLFHAAP